MVTYEKDARISDKSHKHRDVNIIIGGNDIAEHEHKHIPKD
jgi:hypothetical protein